MKANYFTSQVDLPFHAHRYEGPLDPVIFSHQQDPVLTAYSVLACSMGYTVLRAFARALERRAKHAYAVLVLDVCVAILTLRDDSDGRRKLQRELCVVSARQSEQSSNHCTHVLRDMRECFECERTRAFAHLTKRRGAKSTGLLAKSHALSCIATYDLHELIYATELLISRFLNVGSAPNAHSSIQDLQMSLLRRRRHCTTPVMYYEIGLALQIVALNTGIASIKKFEPASAAVCLKRALQVSPTSHRRRIAILSHLVRAEVLRGNVSGARLALRRLERLRWCACVYTRPGRPAHDVIRSSHSDLNQPMWDAFTKGQLVTFCDENVDLGQLVAEVALLAGHAKQALRALASTISAVEAAVSHIGTPRGLSELGSLYELRGRAQVELAKGAEAFPFHINDLVTNSSESHYHCQRFDLLAAGLKSECRRMSDESLGRSRSRHFRSYDNAMDLQVDALRWYRHALGCFRATDDIFGVARAASSFATLHLGSIFLKKNLANAPSSQRLRGGMRRPDDIFATVHHALELAAVIHEPLLLLEAYLNVAELRHINDDSLSAIAHWWEARELLLRLFVDGVGIPLASIADPATALQLRNVLERLLRFLAAVADKAMLDENIILFEVFILFEHDARPRRQQRDSPHCNRNVYEYEAGGQGFIGRSFVANVNPWFRAALDVRSCWNCIIRTRIDIRRHCHGRLNLNELQNRNRQALCKLAATMRRLRLRKGEIREPASMPTAYAIHVAGALIIYTPHRGWRHALAFGRIGRGLDAAAASLVGAFAGARRVVAKRNGIDHRRCTLSRISHIIALPRNFFSNALAIESTKTAPTLVCSERARVLPWECLADSPVSRKLCASDVELHFFGKPDVAVAWNPSTLRLLSMIGAGIVPPEDVAVDARCIIDTLVHDLSSPSLPDADSGRYYTEDRYRPSATLKMPIRDGQCAGCCATWHSNPRVAGPIRPGRPLRVLPVSMLYAPEDALLQLQAKHTELIFAPDAVVPQVNARFRSRSVTAKPIELAKRLSDELALPVIHSV